MSVLQPMLLAPTVLVLSRKNRVAMGNSTHAGRKGSIFIFSVREKRPFDEIILPGNPVLGTFSQRLMSFRVQSE
jgi:hypothetical protein